MHIDSSVSMPWRKRPDANVHTLTSLRPDARKVAGLNAQVRVAYVLTILRRHARSGFKLTNVSSICGSDPVTPRA